MDFAADSSRKIAYAPSVGTTQLRKKEKDRIKDYLNRFYRISVREESSKGLIGNLVDKPVQVVCDPVFLLSMDQWIQNMQLQLKNHDEKYTLLFLGRQSRIQKSHREDTRSFESNCQNYSNQYVWI
mgnify:CR=1 FL=1